MTSYSGTNLPHVLQRALEEKLVYTPDGGTLPLEANVSEDEAVTLYTVVRELRPEVSVEVGFAKGVSTLAILQAIADNGRGHHHVIDPFQKNYGYAGLEMVERAGLSSSLTFHETFAENVVPNLPTTGFAFIDSSHLYDLTIAEFVLIDKKLSVGGVVGFHDLWMPSLQQVVRYVLSNRSYRLRSRARAADQAAPLRASLSLSQAKKRLRRRLGHTLNRLPGADRILSPEVRRPWETLEIPNLVLLEKTANDDRDWRFHRSF